MINYLPRLADDELARGLQASGAVEICGPRACGKTETARQAVQARNGSEIRLDDAGPALDLLRMDPAQVLPGETPRLIDEWQAIPQVWNLVRHAVDDRRERGQFILTGSATPSRETDRHSGAGRIRSLTMRTMTLQERGFAPGGFSLAALLSGQAEVGASCELSIQDYVSALVSGGWPGLLGLEVADAEEEIASYVQRSCEHDFPEIAGYRRDPRRFEAFLTAYAGVVAQPASFAAITRRIGELLPADIGERMVPAFHDFAARMYLVEDQPAWSTRLRSRSTLVQTPKRHLADVSLAASLLHASPQRILRDPQTLGFLFESLVVHELRVFAQAIRARGVFHFRDIKGRLELDAVVEGREGAWAGFEVKTSHLAVDQAAANLLKVAGHIEYPPAALAVIIPTGPVVRRPDGVWVIPLGTLTS